MSADRLREAYSVGADLLAPSLLERFVTKIDDSGECWLWTGALNTMGYGQILVSDGIRMLAHRVAVILATRRALHPSAIVMHACDNPKCVRPEHLSVGTMSDNIQDAIRKGRHRNQNMGRTVCKRGHPLTPENTIVGATRACRACAILRKRAKREAAGLKIRPGRRATSGDLLLITVGAA